MSLANPRHLHSLLAPFHNLETKLAWMFRVLGLNGIEVTEEVLKVHNLSS